MPNRKIIFVIVEGASDEYALGVILNRIYDLNHVYIHVMHSDITTARNVTAQNIVSKVGDLVRNYAKGKFSKKDFFRIIQITDTDGAFIPDENVVKNPEKTKPYYLNSQKKYNNFLLEFLLSYPREKYYNEYQKHFLLHLLHLLNSYPYFYL